MPFSPIFSLPPVEQKSAKARSAFLQSSPAHLYLACALLGRAFIAPMQGKRIRGTGAHISCKGSDIAMPCHTSRNPLGASRGRTIGRWANHGLKLVRALLTSLQEASTADWPLHDLIQLLKTGLSSRAATAGPMADVVSQSLQHLDEQDAHAMATYLKSLPQSDPRSRGVAPPHRGGR